MLFLLVSSLLLLLLRAVHAQNGAQPMRPPVFDDLPQCARYSYLESAIDSPCYDSDDRYCLCASSELDKVLAATYTRAVLYCEPKAPEMTALVAGWLNSICEPRTGTHYRRRRWISTPAVLLANKTDEPEPGPDAVKKKAAGGRRFKRGGIVGIAIAAVVGLVIVVLAVFSCYVAWLGDRWSEALDQGIP